MNERTSTKLLVAQCSLSLAEAVQRAGGGIDAEGMLDLTLGEFIAEVAGQNYIRFVYAPPAEKKSKPEKIDQRRRSRRDRQRSPARLEDTVDDMDEEEDDDLDELLEALDPDEDENYRY